MHPLFYYCPLFDWAGGAAAIGLLYYMGYTYTDETFCSSSESL